MVLKKDYKRKKCSVESSRIQVMVKVIVTQLSCSQEQSMF